MMAMLGILALIGIVGAGRLIDASWVHVVARDTRDLMALARDQATATGTRTSVRFDGVQHRVVVHAGTDTIARYDALEHGGVRLASTRDSMAYAPSGLGFGASNLRLVLSKGASAETVTVSRLGRVSR